MSTRQVDEFPQNTKLTSPMLTQRAQGIPQIGSVLIAGNEPSMTVYNLPAYDFLFVQIRIAQFQAVDLPFIRFNDDSYLVRDAGPNAQHAAAIGQVLPAIINEGGVFGARFEGENRGANSSGFNAGTGFSVSTAWTLEASAKLERTDRSQVIAGRYRGDAPDQPMIWWDVGNSAWSVSYIDTGGTYRNVIGGTANGKLQHIAASYDGTTLSLFVDGALVGTSTPGAGPGVNASARFLIGRSDDWNQAGNGGYPIQGFIDWVRLSNVARYTAAFTPPADLPASDANTVVQYGLNANFAARDFGGNGQYWWRLVNAAPGNSTFDITSGTSANHVRLNPISMGASVPQGYLVQIANAANRTHPCSWTSSRGSAGTAVGHLGGGAGEWGNTARIHSITVAGEGGQLLAAGSGIAVHGINP